MLDWIGSLVLRERSSRRVVVALSPTTRAVGLGVLTLGVYGAWLAWPVSPWLVMLPACVVGLGLMLSTMRRELTFDGEDGVLRMDQCVIGIPSRAVIPLFHLRAVVIVARGAEEPSALSLLAPARYVAYIDRRVGEAIYLDESRRCASLLEMAEAIADVADLRLEYDAMSRASGTES